MRNNVGLLILCVFASLLFTQGVAAKALRSPVQTGSEIIIAKGDIPTPEKYKQVTATYMDYVSENIENMICQLNNVKSSLKVNNIASAQVAYVRAHQYYEMVRPIVRLFGHTDRVINSRSDDFLDGVKDYRFKGFHLVEYLLFNQKNTQVALAAVDELLMNSNDLARRVKAEDIDIAKLIQSSADFIEMVLETKISGKENRYSLSDLADIAANVKGSLYIVDEVKPFIPKDSLTPILHNYSEIMVILDGYKLNDNEYKLYNSLSSKDKTKLYSVLTQQAYLLATLRAKLNLDVYYKY
ncbi:EfeM/EfeO family lipoprotein [Photobacterium kishitanii]|uniref:EfeM/EfeO family lipoprotein n=1 Tax=Photobacterium kishitanii TaxID=318456 RepID=UPI0007F8D27B|nr:EfeM/EfeO family lipoprotein [Photobacterium kishitanii]OBU30782.1 hypothetical protein AYY23_05430 [Photobacterium kishitanii]PSW48663.1 EfeM/EfeO family lipoprotein [Photobacterium kishitanii]